MYLKYLVIYPLATFRDRGPRPNSDYGDLFLTLRAKTTKNSKIAQLTVPDFGDDEEESRTEETGPGAEL